MPHLSKKTASNLALALIAGMAMTQAQALGVGEIEVRSNLNQRFNATLGLSGVAKGELDGVSVRLASNEEFARAGIERSEVLGSLNFEVKESGSGQPYVQISGRQIVKEPILRFLVEIRSKGTRTVREYTALLDPTPVREERVEAPKPEAVRPAVVSAPLIVAAPTGDSRRTVVAESQPYVVPESVAIVKTTPKANEKPVLKPVKPTLITAKATAAASPNVSASVLMTTDRSYGPIKTETLWRVATNVRPDSSVTMDQVLLAIYHNNPKAFDRGDFRELMKGTTLNIPTKADMLAVPVSVARSEVAALMAGKRRPRPSAMPQANPTSAPTVKPETKKPEVKVAETAKPLPKPAEIKLPAKPEVKATVKPATKPVELKPVDVKPPEVKPVPKVVTVVKPEVKVTFSTEKPAPVKPVAASTTVAKPAPIIVSAKAPVSAVISTTATKPTLLPAATVAAAVSASTTVAITAPTAPTLSVPRVSKPLVIPPPEAEVGLLDGLGDLVLPLVGGAGALLVGLVGLLYTRRRKATEVATDEGDSDWLPPSVSGSPAVPVDVLDEGVGFRDELSPPVVDTQVLLPEAVQTREMPVPDFDKTQILKAPESLSQPTLEKNLDFDMTAQMQAQTVALNLNADDPVSEADFHLAYGLFDEAILLLKQAAQKHPERADIQLKLAETYFAAGRPLDFQTLAEEVQGTLPSSDWQKLAIMGRQLCPDASLFQSSGSLESSDTDFDLNFDDSPSSNSSATGANIGEMLTVENAIEDADSIKAARLSMDRIDFTPSVVPSVVSSTGAAANDLSLPATTALDSLGSTANANLMDVGIDFVKFDIEPISTAPAMPANLLQNSLGPQNFGETLTSGGSDIDALLASFSKSAVLTPEPVVSVVSAIPEPSSFEIGKSVDFSMFAPDLKPEPKSELKPESKPETLSSAPVLENASDSPINWAAAEAADPAPRMPVSRALEMSLSQIPAHLTDSLSIESAARAQIFGNSPLTDLRMEDLDVSITPRDNIDVGGDEASTKIELARAYLEMGDNDMAKSLLAEVILQGDEAQKHEAHAMIQRAG
jgi:pilus assembly protein FimV